jgi:signal transduction histidine kinase
VKSTEILEKSTRYFKRAPIAFAVLVLGLIITGFAWYFAKQKVDQEAKELFNEQAVKAKNALDNRIQVYLDTFQAARGFWNANHGNVNYEQWKIFADSLRLQERYPGINGIGFIRYVQNSEKTAYEQRVRKNNGLINSIYANYQIQPPGDRSEYFAVEYYEPIPTDVNIMGFDVGIEPVRRKAAERARDTGKAAATKRITLIRDGDQKKPALLIYLPVYRQSITPTNLLGRRENLEGFIYASFVAEELIRETLSDALNQDFDLSIYNGTDLMYGQDLTLVANNPNSHYRQVMTIDIAGETWDLYFTSRPNLRIGSGQDLPPLILFVGILISILLFTIVWSLASSRNQALFQNEQIKQTLLELQHTQAQLIQTEKMSSLGQLVAGVAHEINNPVNFIYGNLTYTYEYAKDLLDLVHLYQQHYLNPPAEIQAELERIEPDFLMEDLSKVLSSMKIGADRIRQIVLSLRNFSRLDESEMKSVDIHEGIDSTLLILQSRLHSDRVWKETGNRDIQVIKEYGDLPLIECYAGQLNQVFMNILTNAIDALEEMMKQELGDFTPTIKISTGVLDRNQVMIKIVDNGPGMTEEVKKKLFDPFFTTKSIGKGTGLGMAISYQIIEKHGGKLWYDSEPGKGAEFLIQIPVQQNLEI